VTARIDGHSPQPPTAPATATTAAHSAKRAKELEFATREFEQIFVRAMLKGSPIAGKGDAYGDMAVDAMAKSVTQGHGLGLGELIRKTIENADPPLKVSPDQPLNVRNGDP
jgi:Rod binding domain-containing protein